MHFRRLVYKAHLYVGLMLGGFFLLLSLTGSILVFYPEIDLLLHPEMRVQQPLPKTISVQSVFDALRLKYPTLEKGWRIEMPLAKGFPIFARYLKPDQNNAALFAPLVVSVNPLTHEVTSERIWGDYLVTWIFDLHYQLLIGDIGKSIVVIVGILLMFNGFFGLYLWFPKSISAWKHALIVKMNAHPMRKNYDIHKLAGVFGLILILVMSFTGALLGRADWFNPMIQKFSHIDTYVPSPIKIPTLEPISVDAAVAIAKATYPEAELRWIYTPDTANDYYQIRMHQASEPGRRFPKTILWIDQYSGQVKYIKKPEAFSAGDTILAWLHPLHNGEAFGVIGRLLAVLSGIFIVVLCWTGLRRTLYKQKVKYQISSKAREF
ncbi:MAG: PepSY-associated TM helix domain-containing protein [Methylotenera sp.]|nr:PepSY-associated TM helix domain-containing protein [Methylotenera sp.]